MHDAKAHLNKETKLNCKHFLPITFSMRFEPFGELPSTQTSTQKLISRTKTKHKEFLRKSHVVWLNAQHQGTSTQGNDVSLQSSFTHTILNAF